MRVLLVFIILSFATSVMAQSYKTGQGFQYKTPKKEQEETKSKGQVKVLRFYNQNSKVTDPLTESVVESDEEQVHFFKVTDSTLKDQKSREISSLSDVSITDYEVLEHVIRDLEHEMGIRSMPVMRFHKDNAPVDGLIERLRYMEHRLGILKDVEAQNLVITDRIQNLKEKIEARYK